MLQNIILYFLMFLFLRHSEHKNQMPVPQINNTYHLKLTKFKHYRAKTVRLIKMKTFYGFCYPILSMVKYFISFREVIFKTEPCS
jgi:hypothetical protein